MSAFTHVIISSELPCWSTANATRRSFSHLSAVGRLTPAALTASPSSPVRQSSSTNTS